MYQFTKEQNDYHLPFYTAGMLNVITDLEKCSLEYLPRDKKEIYKEVFKRLIIMIDEQNTLEETQKL